MRRRHCTSVAEHRHRNGNAEDPAEKAQHAVGAGRLADICRCDGVEDGTLGAGIAIETPVPATMSGAMSCAYATFGAAIVASHAIPAACSDSPTTTSHRSPIRLTTEPASGATMKRVAVHGNMRSPAPSASLPCAV